MSDISKLIDFYNIMEKRNIMYNGTFVFVFNGEDTYTSDPHLEECYDEQEVQNILDSVYDLFEEIKSFSSEKNFIQWANYLQNKESRIICVYSMAQNIDGYGRRTLVPAVCEYYGFINLNASSYMSAIGCNKMSMFSLLYNKGFKDLIAPTIFVKNLSEVNYKEFKLKLGNKIIIKPICESCCIDVSVLEEYSEKILITNLKKILKKHKVVMIQTFIEGKEIGITSCYFDQHMYALKPMEIIFPRNKTYLSHNDSYYTNYRLQPLETDNNLINRCLEMNSILEFECITRFDFRYDGNKYYLFDLSPNPTLNGYVSSNLAAQNTFECDHRGIFRLMVYINYKLLEPSLNSSV